LLIDGGPGQLTAALAAFREQQIEPRRCCRWPNAKKDLCSRGRRAATARRMPSPCGCCSMSRQGRCPHHHILRRDRAGRVTRSTPHAAEFGWVSEGGGASLAAECDRASGRRTPRNACWNRVRRPQRQTVRSSSDRDSSG
jgi:hypothetical protein